MERSRHQRDKTNKQKEECRENKDSVESRKLIRKLEGQSNRAQGKLIAGLPQRTEKPRGGNYLRNNIKNSQN